MHHLWWLGLCGCVKLLNEFYEVRMVLRICRFFAIKYGVCTLNYPRGHTLRIFDFPIASLMVFVAYNSGLDVVRARPSCDTVTTGARARQLWSFVSH